MTYDLNKFPYYLIIFIPPLLITGPFFPDLTVIFCCIFFLFLKSFRNFLFKLILENKIIKLYLFFFIIGIASSLLSDHLLISLKSSLFHFRFILFGVVYFYIINRDENFLRYQHIILLLTLCLLNFDSIFQLITGVNVIGLKIQQAFIPRPTSFFGENLKIGNFLFNFSLFNLGLSIYLKRYLKVSFFLVFFSWVIIFFSGERTSFILYSTSLLIIFLLFLFDKKYLKKNKLYLILAVLIGVIFLMNNGFTKKMYVTKMIIHPLEELSIIGDGDFMPAHINHYAATLYIFKKNPIIGSGSNTFSKKCKMFEQEKNLKACTTHPHNFYLQILSENGIIGFFVAILFYFYLIFNFIKSCKVKIKNPSNNIVKSFIVFNVLLLMIFFPLRPTGDIFNNWLSIINLFSLGLYSYLNVKMNKLEISK